MKTPPRTLSINTAADGDGLLVRIEGEIDLNSSPQFRTTLLGLLDRRAPRIILDLTGVSYVDSSGVGTMVELKRRADRGGFKVTLFGLQDRVRSIFEITRLDKFLNIASSLDEARRA